MRLGPPPAEPEVPGQFWIDFIRDTAPVFRKPTIEQLGEFIAPTWQALIDGAKYVHPRLLEIFDELGPDVIVEDNVVAFPALAAIGPAVGPDRVVQPGRAQGPGRRAVLVRLPGRGSDRLAALPRGGAPDARRACGPTSTRSVASTATTASSYGELGPDFIAESPWLNLYRYPAEADYRARAPARPDLASARLVRSGPRSRPGSCPSTCATRDGALIYLSLGSLGSADVGLMQRLVDLLATTEHRVIVSKGPLADQIALHDNQAGEGFLPQPADPAAWSTWSSPTAATTPSPRRSTTASR